MLRGSHGHRGLEMERCIWVWENKVQCKDVKPCGGRTSQTGRIQRDQLGSQGPFTVWGFCLPSHTGLTVSVFLVWEVCSVWMVRIQHSDA